MVDLHAEVDLEQPVAVEVVEQRAVPARPLVGVDAGHRAVVAVPPAEEDVGRERAGDARHAHHRVRPTVPVEVPTGDDGKAPGGRGVARRGRPPGVGLVGPAHPGGHRAEVEVDGVGRRHRDAEVGDAVAVDVAEGAPGLGLDLVRTLGERGVHGVRVAEQGAVHVGADQPGGAAHAVGIRWPGIVLVGDQIGAPVARDVADRPDRGAVAVGGEAGADDIDRNGLGAQARRQRLTVAVPVPRVALLGGAGVDVGAGVVAVAAAVGPAVAVGVRRSVGGARLLRRVRGRGVGGVGGVGGGVSGIGLIRHRGRARADAQQEAEGEGAHGRGTATEHGTPCAGDPRVRSAPNGLQVRDGRRGRGRREVRRRTHRRAVAARRR